MRIVSSIILLFVLSVSFLEIKAQNVLIYKKDGFDLTKCNTYAFSSGYVLQNRDTISNVKYNNIVRNAFDSQKFNHKLGGVVEDASLKLKYYIGVQNIQDLTTYGWNITMPKGVLSMLDLNTNYPVLVIVVELIDPKTDLIVWAGIVSDRYYAEKDPNTIVNNAMKLMFEKYPNVVTPNIPDLNVSIFRAKPLPPKLGAVRSDVIKLYK